MPEKTLRTKAEKQAAVHEVMHEYKHGQLHSGSKHGPKVKSRKQAIAIAMSESNQSKNYDRKAHNPGNPGFPSHPSAGKSPFPNSHQAHEQREREVMGAGYKQHEAAEKRSYGIGPSHKFSMSKPSSSQNFGYAAHQRAGHHRLSGHSGAHRIGKRK